MTHNLRALASALGGDVVGASVLVPGPGHSAKDRSLSITPSIAAPDGLLFFSHAGDDRRLCREYILGRLGNPVERFEPREAPKPRIPSSNGWEAIWKDSSDPRGSVVERYLASRGLELFDDMAGRVVRFHPNCPFGPGQRLPCMVTAFRSIVTDKLQAIHRSALTSDGKKIDRKMLGSVGGAAIKITADTDVEEGVAIGEGFETCLAARALGFSPVWALGSAQAIASFPVLPGIEALTILSEDDKTGANRKAMGTCAERWTKNDREVLVVRPRAGGDINDALVA
jgi:hypothetical protein